MCGITGWLTGPEYGAEEMQAICRKMNDALTHRGPDDAGLWLDADAGIVLGQRRLSIIDLSPLGHQPMLSPDGRFVFVLNGEIYNHSDLRSELEGLGFRFRGSSDTEVAIAAIQHYGFVPALEKFVGMYAMAVWDRERHSLRLARDRMGEKPLYYGNFGGVFAFASELKALTHHPRWQGTVNRDALALQMRYSYIPAPWSIYEGVHKLPPGCWVEVTGGDGRKIAEPVPYWSVGEAWRQGTSNRTTQADPAQRIDELEQLLTNSISRQMIADVPLGAFLSGGIDSTTVVALMQASSSRPVRTFSIGFTEAEYNEAHHAAAVAGHLGTDHTELYVSPEDAMAVIPRLPAMYDEPFSDASQIPTFLVSELARHQVTVALSGDGGDELFGGYSRYLVGREAWNRIAAIPAPMRRVGSRLIHAMPPHWLDVLSRPVKPLLPAQLRYQQFGQKLHKLAHIWNTTTPDSIYNGLICLWQDPASVVVGSRSVDSLAGHRPLLADMADFTERMMYTDMVSYLPDDILVKVDRASMAVSLEVRVPFLDHRIVEFAWRQPVDLKIQGNDGKWLLRQILYRHVPRHLMDRPKMGFGVPIDHWLRGPLREWAGDLLAEDRLRREGYLNPGPIQEKWRQHLSGEISWQYLLWPVLMFQAWREHWRA